MTDGVQGIGGDAFTPGDGIEPFEHTCTKLELLHYASVSRDLNMIHHDVASAQESGLSDIIVQGTFKAGLFARMLADLAGEHGFVTDLSVQYRGMDHVGDLMRGHGEISSRHEEASTVSLRLWLDGRNGKSTTLGSGTVRFGWPWPEETH
jgi:acyl dehydratase